MVTPDDDTRDRVIALGRDVAHLTARVEDLTLNVRGLTQVINQTRGGWRILLGLLGFAGAVGAAIASAFPWSKVMP